jgi:acetyl esterase/lipase
VYAPTERDGRLPGVLYIHGGGFVLGSVDTEHAGAVLLARAVGAVVVSVDYRLAPEHPFPAGLDDCYDALTWMRDAADQLEVDLDRLALFGNSAGGGLAAAVALLSRDRGGPSLSFQYLGIPELDDRLETVSMQTFVDTPMWNRPNAELSWQHYLGDDRGEVSAYAAPARATDLSGLPPTYISTMEFDPLRDEGLIYGLRLLQAGVTVELHQFPGTFHGSALVFTAATSVRQSAETMDVMRRALHG